MSAAYTIILPHKTNPGNDAALKIALDMLIDNSLYDFHLIIDRAANSPLYERINGMVEQARTDYVVYWSSDMFCSPGWDVPIVHEFHPNRFLTFALVEPGIIGIYPHNIGRNFGVTPQTFRRQAWENWLESDDCKGLNLSPKGWYAPVVYPREGFLRMGGLQTDMEKDFQGFSAADMALFDEWEAVGNEILRVRSFVYHLQRYSEIEEQQKRVGL